MSADLASSSRPPRVAVYGASGLAGASLCRALAASGMQVHLVGRDRSKLEAAAATLPPGAAYEISVAAVEDRAKLVAAFVGARVVVNAAGPFASVGDAVVTSAIAAGCHYLDLCGEQAVLRHVFERCDAAARHAEVAVVPGAGFAVAMGDLLAATAAARLLEHHDDGPTVRHIAGKRLTSAEPLAISVAYLFDDLTLSAGAQASVFANLHAPMVVWRRDRWDTERAGRRARSFNPGPPPADDAIAPRRAPTADPAPPQSRPPGADAHGSAISPAGVAASYEREAFSLGGGDNLTIPRHIAATSVDTFLSLSRRPQVHQALRLAAMAASLLPAAAASLLVPSPPDPSAYAATRFAVVAAAEHPFDVRYSVAHGRDLYATSTVITCRLALALARRPQGPCGVLAPAEIVRAPSFLAELARDRVIALR
ncbi:MAG: saccharopine dehydrogenase NADP-binding domain-containing protein [Myxococcales bacterium]|nr:saccharopine dehydrogenase NADP-binding domain-containing protein [Myxococcales bacterium]